MRVITNSKEMQNVINEQKAAGKSVGFVPTMGYLHEGHLSLLERARKENDLVVLSIFVNPTQFGPNEDFETYPRDFERDQVLAEGVKTDYLFHPSVQEMYPNDPSVSVHVQKRSDVLCGRSRPGHFDGVATVVTKLFHITMPTRAYFGSKDAQQVAVIEGLIADFNFPIKLVAVDIVREEDGLAKSSRNVKLLPQDRRQAPVLYKTLQAAMVRIEQGERNPEVIVAKIRETIEKETSGVIDYVEMYQYPQLAPLETIKGRFIIALAVWFNQVRLIDNVIVTVE